MSYSTADRARRFSGLSPSEKTSVAPNPAGARKTGRRAPAASSPRGPSRAGALFAGRSSDADPAARRRQNDLGRPGVVLPRRRYPSPGRQETDFLVRDKDRAAAVDGEIEAAVGIGERAADLGLDRRAHLHAGQWFAVRRQHPAANHGGACASAAPPGPCRPGAAPCRCRGTPTPPTG